MSTETILLGLTLLAGLYMTWSIGANDVANAIGTSVGSRALSLRTAVIMAAILEFSGAFFFGSHVTSTIEEGVVNGAYFVHEPLTLVYGMLAVLLGAGSWLLIATYYGLPVSTTHSIVGAMVGFGLTVGGLEAINWENIGFIAFSWILSPLCGGLFAYVLFYFVRKWIFYSTDPVKATLFVTPYIVFFFMFVFLMIFTCQEFEQFQFYPTLFESTSISITIALVAFLIAYFWLKQLHIPPSPLLHPVHPQSITREISRARKGLSRLQGEARGDAQNKVSNLLRQFEEVAGDLAETESELHQPDFHIIERIFGKLQVMSACMMAFSHGANDVANAIGPLAAALNVLLNGYFVPHQPVSIYLLALGGFGIVLGLATWGWRVVETIGRGITELTPTRGFAAEFGAAFTILIASRIGLPISSTHTLVGAVLGVGFARGLEAINRDTIRDIVVSWAVTIPIGGIAAVGFFYLIRSIFG